MAQKYNDRLEAFLTHVKITDTCHIWTGTLSSDGYGKVSLGGVARTTTPAHKFYWEWFNGPVPQGYHLHHKCNVRACVRLDHLEPIHPIKHGQLNNAVMLSMEKATEIRKKLLCMTDIELGQEFGVSRTTIYHIRKGDTWKI